MANVGILPFSDGKQLICGFCVSNEKPEIIAIAKLMPDEDIKGAVIAASELGKGKLVLFGSPLYFERALLQNKSIEQLLKNTIAWGANGRRKLKIAVPGDTDPAFIDFLRAQKAEVCLNKNKELQKHTSILILTEDVQDSLQQAEVESFIRKGGTLLFASPYGERMKNTEAGRSAANMPLRINDLLLKAGVYAPNFLITPRADNQNLITDSIPAYLQLNTILSAFKNNQDIFSNQTYEFLIAPAIDLMIENNELNSPVIQQYKLFLDSNDSIPLPSKTSPLGIGSPRMKLLYRLKYQLAKKMFYDKDHSAKAPAAQLFPGQVPADAQSVSKELSIPVRVGIQGLHEPSSVFYRPHTTGLYAAAGDILKIRISAKDLKQHLKVQIGVHSDDLMHMQQLTREGVDLTRTFELDKEETEVYSPYGGLLLLNISDTTQLKTISIKVEAAVKSPYFKLGTTTVEEWKNTIRNAPGPWAELVTDKIILTVPSERIRQLEDPVKLLQFWDEVMDADADLAMIPAKRRYPERIIVDEQVAYGYMFTMPDRIVVPDDKSTELMLDENALRTSGSWGHFHEMGHRHQFWGIDFDGTSEVTVNLYSMYIYDQVLKKGIYNHDAIPSKAAVEQKVKNYLFNSPSYEKWMNDPFIALSMYIEIIEEFGWAPIKEVHAKYRKISPARYPQSNQERIDLWFVTLSAVTHRNMTAFFEAWKIPVSEDAKKKVQNYPGWLPITIRLYGFLK